MISQIEEAVDNSVAYGDLVPGGLFTLDDNGTIFMKLADLTTLNLQTGLTSTPSPFRVLPVPNGAKFVYYSNRVKPTQS